MLTLPPLSLYVHIPWCVRKCPYCDFNSHALHGDIPEQDYITHLLNDLQQELPLAQDRPLTSIFIGGGTPSLLSARAIASLLEGINRYLPLGPEIEITLEANPGTFEQARFSDFKAAGINRLSVGVQSFSPEHLKALGRIHSARDAATAIEAAHRLEFKEINIDLMHGLPKQTQTQALADLDTALALAPSHLSWYQLTLEPNTEFYLNPPSLPQDDTLWSIQQAGQARLAAAGFEQYEVSAYAGNPQSRAAHNLNYWQFGDYLGIGAGAHGKITLPARQQIIRRWKLRSPKHYMQSVNYLGGENIIEPQELPFEFMLNALRLNSGVAAESFSRYTGLPLSVLSGPWQQAQKQGLMVPGSQFRTTPKGALFLNDLLALFMP